MALAMDIRTAITCKLSSIFEENIRESLKSITKGKSGSQKNFEEQLKSE